MDDKSLESTVCKKVCWFGGGGRNIRKKDSVPV
jgi:hypothetical protein